MSMPTPATRWSPPVRSAGSANPVLTCTAVTALGLALVVPNVLAVLMLAGFVVAWEIQVRLVEEPYLARIHGDDYKRYAARTGRFLPGIGRLPGPNRPHD